MVAPIGKQNLATRGSMPISSSKHFIVMGSEAELKYVIVSYLGVFVVSMQYLEAVPNAVAMGCPIFDRKVIGDFRVNTK